MSSDIASEVFVVAARRTPIGRLNGALASVPAVTLGVRVVEAALADARISPAQVSELVFGQVLTAGLGQNPARQTALGAGLPVEIPATTINMVCGSGQRAIHVGAQAIRLGEAGIVVAGGQENMSLAPHVLALRRGHKLGDLTAIDTVMRDGLSDAFNHVLMGVTAERLAARYGISREAQDAFALASQQKAGAAIAAGRFVDEIAAITVPARKGETVVDTDEAPVRDSTPEKLARLRPAFEEGGTVTAGNASGINDGAAAVVLASGRMVAELGLSPLARVASWAATGIAPMDMGLGPVGATHRALERAGLRLDEIELIEVNEAFAAQALAVGLEMGWDPERVNVNGGAIALGHPIGASGCRVVVTLLHEMRRRGGPRGLASLCIGGGMGVAICLDAT